MCEATFDLSGGKNEPKCQECVPELLPENYDLMSIYMKVQNQHIMGFGGPVDLDFGSVKFIMDLYEVPAESRKMMFEKVYRLYRITLASMREIAELEKEADQP